MSEEVSDTTVISISFSHAGEDSLVEVMYGDDRDQSEDAGIIKNASARITSSPVITEICDQIQRLGDELTAEIWKEIHKPAPTRPSGLRR